ncbi:MAG: serine hydrolase domain-containing protein, partial [Chitinophagales bacterium]
MNSNFLLAFLLTFFSLCAFSQVSPNLENKIDSIVEHHLEVDKIVGFSVGIVKNGEVLFTKGYGTRTMGEEQPIDSLTNFLTCSISKLFTATAIMQLEEQGKIDLNEHLVTYLPDFEMKDKRYKEITIQQMLTHTSGLSNFFNPNFIKPAHDSLALQMFADKFKTKKLKFEPGVALSADTYSNTAYNILGLVIERITGQNYSEYMNQHILKPVGMTNSSFFYKEIPANRRSTPHKMNFITKQVKVADYYPDIPQDKPCGNLNSCSADLCK